MWVFGEGVNERVFPEADQKPEYFQGAGLAGFPLVGYALESLSSTFSKLCDIINCSKMIKNIMLHFSLLTHRKDEGENYKEQPLFKSE